MEKDSPSDSSQPSFLKSILQFFKLLKTPDTAEEIEQEIQDILEEGEEQGLISPQEGEMINSIFAFRETMAREVMTPHTEMVCAPDTATIQEIIALIKEKGFSRIPIFRDTSDHIIGILHAKDLLNYCAKDTKAPLAGEITKPAHVVPENQKIFLLLRDFQTQKNHMAIVSDEFGSVRGLVTLEDILEEIVGEITDEYDKEDRRLKVIDDTTIICDARLDLEEIEKHLNVELPEGPYESVGGLVIHSLGKLPEPGTSVEINSLTFQVLSATKRRVGTIKIKKRKQ